MLYYFCGREICLHGSRKLGLPSAAFSFMHLLYIDESGSPKDASQQHFIMVGVSLFERQGHWLALELDKIAARFDPANPQNIELHGNPMKQGKGQWKTIPGADRAQAFQDALEVLANSHKSNRLFGVAVKKALISPVDPVEYAFEQILSRFDHYLMRLHKTGDTQRGLVILDRNTNEQSLQNLAREFRTIGHRWGVLRNLSEVPLFLDSKASRLIQLADLVSYSFFRHIEQQDSSLFNIIKDRFDTEGGIVHGLHIRQ
jgi:Protein of unknown function (DUF3800)